MGVAPSPVPEGGSSFVWANQHIPSPATLIGKGQAHGHRGRVMGTLRELSGESVSSM